MAACWPLTSADTGNAARASIIIRRGRTRIADRPECRLARGSCPCSLNRQMIIRHVTWRKTEVDKPSACDTAPFGLLASASEIHFAKIPTRSLLLSAIILLFAFVFRSQPLLSVQLACTSMCVCLDCLRHAGFLFSLPLYCNCSKSQKLCPRFQRQTSTGCEHNIPFDSADKTIL